jgi:hypothetical protein
MRTGSTMLSAVGAACALAGSVAAQTPATRVVSAANAFLATLDQRQKDSVLFAFTDEAQRKRWSNLPVGIVQRGGLSMDR